MINTATSSGDNESCRLHKCTIPYIWWRGGGGGGEGDVVIKLWRTLTHHLSDAETVSEVVKRIVTIILLDCQLWGKAGAESMDPHSLTPSHSHQPPLECDWVDVQCGHQAQLVVHVLH